MFVFTIVALALLSLHCPCTRAESATSDSKVQYSSKHHRRRSGGRSYQTVPAFVLSEYEGRQGGSHISDYALHGLSNIEYTQLKYGLRESESFYWGKGKH